MAEDGDPGITASLTLTADQALVASVQSAMQSLPIPMETSLPAPIEITMAPQMLSAEDHASTGGKEVLGLVESQPAEDDSEPTSPSPVSTKRDPPVQPAFDSRVWCQDCGSVISGLRCQSHGDLSHVRDRVIPCRAKLTAPHLVSIKTIELRPGDKNKCGVFARKVIQRRTEFGPYEGAALNQWLYEGQDRLKLKIFRADGSSSYLDCTNQNECNWMMYVRPAENYAQQNMVAYQYKGRIFFVTIKVIPPNEELRVWYAEHYAAMMGVSTYKPSLTNGAEPVEPIVEETSPDLIEANAREDEDDEVDSGAILEEAVKPEDPAEEPVLPLDRRRRSAKRASKRLGETMYAGLPRLSLTQYGTYLCSGCSATFVTLLAYEGHSCFEDSDNETKAGRRTRNKRKGRPVKLGDKGRVPVDKPRRRGRPSKQSKLSEKTKTTGRGRGRPRGRPPKVPNSGSSEGKAIKKKIKDPKPLHPCDRCDRAFITESKLRFHMYTHSGERPFKCSYDDCDKAFTSKFKQLRHELIHANDKQHICMYCQKTFSRKDHLKNHLKVHDPNKAMHQCPECGKMYASAYAFRTHLAFHDADKGELSCSVCKEEFEEKEPLIKHLKVHAGARSVKDSVEKRQKCPYCQKLFFTWKDVKRHMVVHTKDRDYLCQHCPQRFGRRDHLVRHLRKTHVDSKTGELSNVGATPKPKRQAAKVAQPAPQAKPEVPTEVPVSDADTSHTIISKFLQSVARGIIDPAMGPDEGMVTVPLAKSDQEHQLEQGTHEIIVKHKTLEAAQSTAAGTMSKPSSAVPSIMTSIGMLPATYLNYPAGVSTSTVNMTGLTSITVTDSKVDPISSIAQQLAEPVMSGHFVPPFLPAAQHLQELNTSTATNPVPSSQSGIQHLQSQPMVHSHQQLPMPASSEQQQLPPQQPQLHPHPQPQPQQSSTQAPSQQTGTVLTQPHPAIILNSLNSSLLTDPHVRLPILQPTQLLTRTSQPIQLQTSTVSGLPQVMGTMGESKQMVLMSVPMHTEGSQDQQGLSQLVSYPDAVKFVLNQFPTNQTQQQPLLQVQHIQTQLQPQQHQETQIQQQQNTVVEKTSNFM